MTADEGPLQSRPASPTAARPPGSVGTLPYDASLVREVSRLARPQRPRSTEVARAQCHLGRGGAFDHWVSR